MKYLASLLMIFTTSIVAAELSCEIIHENIKKIRCKYLALSQEKDRSVTFTWTSPDNSADNRRKSHLIPASHISVYDERYFSGRSEGKWLISVMEESKSSISTEFLVDSNAEVTRIKPEDPILKNALE